MLFRSSTTRKHGGTGLGLSICHSLCEKLGGKIWMESLVGQGCSVIFTLPFIVPEIEAPSPSLLAGRSFLLIDDRDYAEVALASRMKQAGACLEVVADLESGKRAVQATGDGADNFAAVIVSVPVHGKDWETVSTALTECGVMQEKIIALMTGGTKMIAARSYLGGAVTRPVSVSELEAVVAKIASVSVSKQVDIAESVVLDRESLSILLVEDSDTNSMLIELYLEHTPHKLILAGNGVEGLVQFQSKPVDLVFMDIEMPVMDGFECTRRIREWERASGSQPVHIVALTAHALREVHEQALSAGCNTLLTKPISRKTFLQSVTTAC